MANPMTPEAAEGLRDAVALVHAVVRMDKAAEQAILDHCDKSETLLSLATFTAMVAQQAAGLDEAGLLAATQSWVEDIAQATNDKRLTS